MRLFVCVEFPNEIKDYLCKLQNSLKESKFAKVKWIPKKQQHLTLKFLGEVPDGEVDDIKDRLRNIKFKRFKIKLNKFGVYPNEIKINVVWIGVEPEKSIIELQRLIDAETIAYGDLKPGGHITIGRIKLMKNKKEFIGKLKKLEIETLSFDVDNFNLIKSELNKDGSNYTNLEGFRLIG